MAFLRPRTLKSLVDSQQRMVYFRINNYFRNSFQTTQSSIKITGAWPWIALLIYKSSPFSLDEYYECGKQRKKIAQNSIEKSSFYL